MPPASEGRREQKPVGRPLRARIPIRADEVPLMTERFFDFWRVDVFTDTPLAGNPLAVFPRATGLSTVEMAGVAREMNLSETTFVFPSTNPAAHYRNRIFTPGGEIPFPGHPSIGTAFAGAMEGLGPRPDGSSVAAVGGEAPGAAVHARSFVPDLGIEDPATGSAAGACGAYRASRGKLPGPTFVIEQGIEVHHASRIEVSVEMEDGKPKVVRVGGQSIPIIRGNLRLP